MQGELKTNNAGSTAQQITGRAHCHNGKQEACHEGVPQGEPLSPLLANIVLNELDWELERRGHSFARYDDDSQIYTGSKRAGERIKESIERFLETRLRLKVNKAKSAVARPWKRSFLGFTFSRRKGNRLKVADKALDRLKDTLRDTDKWLRRKLCSYIWKQ